jgi:hypothetical protein
METTFRQVIPGDGHQHEFDGVISELSSPSGIQLQTAIPVIPFRLGVGYVVRDSVKPATKLNNGDLRPWLTISMAFFSL